MRFALTQFSLNSRTVVLLVVALLCLALARAAEHAYVAAVAAGFVLVVGFTWPWIVMRLISATVRTSADRCRVGETIELTVVFRNRTPLPLPGIDVAVGGMRGAVVESNPATCRGGEHARSLQIVPHRRGVLDLSTIEIATSFPFGLWRAKRSVRGGGRLIVWPIAETVDAAFLANHSRLVATDFVGSRMTSDGELAGVRAYRRGDSVRTIHWQQTARHDRLIVRERAGGERRGCTVCLDTRRASYADENVFERGVSIVAGIVEQGEREGLSVELRLGDYGLTVADIPGRDAALDALAAVFLSDSATPSADWRGVRGIIVTTSTAWDASASPPGLRPLFADVRRRAGGTR